MWKFIKQTWQSKIAALPGNANQRAEVTVIGQKWLGPGEALRVVEIRMDGASHRVLLWNTKGAAQMLPIDSARGTSC